MARKWASFKNVDIWLNKCQDGEILILFKSYHCIKLHHRPNIGNVVVSFTQNGNAALHYILQNKNAFFCAIIIEKHVEELVAVLKIQTALELTHAKA